MVGVSCIHKDNSRRVERTIHVSGCSNDTLSHIIQGDRVSSQPVAMPSNVTREYSDILSYELLYTVSCFQEYVNTLFVRILRSLRMKTERSERNTQKLY